MRKQTIRAGLKKWLRDSGDKREGDDH